MKLILAAIRWSITLTIMCCVAVVAMAQNEKPQPSPTPKQETPATPITAAANPIDVNSIDPDNRRGLQRYLRSRGKEA